MGRIIIAIIVGAGAGYGTGWALERFAPASWQKVKQPLVVATAATVAVAIGRK